MVHVHTHKHTHTCAYVKMLSTNKFSQQINHILYGKAKGGQRVLQKRRKEKESGEREKACTERKTIWARKITKRQKGKVSE